VVVQMVGAVKAAASMEFVGFHAFLKNLHFCEYLLLGAKVVAYRNPLPPSFQICQRRQFVCDGHCTLSQHMISSFLVVAIVLFSLAECVASLVCKITL
jgi:hypothetical protein